jgi:SIR2-like protein
VRSAPDLHAVEERLFARLARGQLLLLVGAGASRWAGLPSWRETVCALAEDLLPALRDRVPGARDRFVPPGPDERVPVESLLRIPEAHRFLCGEARLVERLSALFDTSGIDPAGLPLHHALVRLSAFVPAIYTTNFDDLLERTFAWAGRPCQVVAGPEDLKAWRVDEAGGRYLPRYPIYKLHGTLGRPGSLVVGEQDFLRRSDLASNPIDLRFCSDVMGRELLLVGYGFNDPNMRWIWAKLRDLEVPPVGWLLEPGSSTDLERVTMEMDGIVRVDLDAREPRRPQELLRLLDALADRCERDLAAPAAGGAATPPSPR